MTRPLRVMVVDDQAAVRALLRALLAQEGMEVVATAASPGEALDRIAAADPDVVLLDARMPPTDGFQAAARILAVRPGQAIVLVSGHVDDAVRARASAAGIAACVSKDELEAIARVVRAIASR